MRYLLSGMLCLATILLVAHVRADLRCPPHIVTRGATLLEVRERCGPPVFEYHYPEEVAPGVWVDVHEWTYEFGGNHFRRLLRFENGRLEVIEVRDKPRKPMADPRR